MVSLWFSRFGAADRLSWTAGRGTSVLDDEPHLVGEQRGEQGQLLLAHRRAAQVRDPVDRVEARAAEVDVVQLGVLDVQAADAGVVEPDPASHRGEEVELSDQAVA